MPAIFALPPLNFFLKSQCPGTLKHSKTMSSNYMSSKYIYHIHIYLLHKVTKSLNL